MHTPYFHGGTLKFYTSKTNTPPFISITLCKAHVKAYDLPKTYHGFHRTGKMPVYFSFSSCFRVRG